MRKPLYLAGADTEVVLDGPALRISQPAHADRWFPLQRLSRVVSGTHVQWQTEALMACAGESVTVSFLGRDGSLQARCIGRHPERLNGLQQRLNDLLESADGLADYRQWLRGMENLALRSLQKRIGAATEPPATPTELRRFFRRQAAEMEAVKAHEALGRSLFDLLVGWVTQELQDHGLATDPLILCHLDLPRDLAGILFWDYQVLRLQWLDQRRHARQGGAPPLAEIASCFEARSVRNQHLLRGLVNRLHCWLAQT
jgi:hypothetical protein